MRYRYSGDLSLVYINVIREPIQRLASWYYYRRYQTGHMRKMPLTERIRVSTHSSAWLLACLPASPSVRPSVRPSVCLCIHTISQPSLNPSRYSGTPLYDHIPYYGQFLWSRLIWFVFREHFGFYIKVTRPNNDLYTDIALYYVKRHL